MEVLQGYWQDFQGNHRVLIALAEELGIDYDPRRVYSDIERKYSTTQSFLYDIQRRLAPPTVNAPPTRNGSSVVSGSQEDSQASNAGQSIT